MTRTTTMTRPMESAAGAEAGTAPPATKTTVTMAAAKGEEGTKGPGARAKAKKSWVEELRKAVEAEKGEGNSAIADSDEESDIEAPAAPVHRRQRQQTAADHRHEAQRGASGASEEGRREEEEEERRRYASVESAAAFLRERGVDARDFAT